MEAIISGAFALLIGIVGLLTGYVQLKNRVALNRWPTTSGKVIERGTFQPNTPTRSAPGFRHAPLVKYVYEVNGQAFTNDRIRPKRIQQPEHNTKQWAQKRAESFPDEVTVHYNPEDPAESFLLQTSKFILYVVIGASSVAILFGLSFLLVFSMK